MPIQYFVFLRNRRGGTGPKASPAFGESPYPSTGFTRFTTLQDMYTVVNTSSQSFDAPVRIRMITGGNKQSYVGHA